MKGFLVVAAGLSLVTGSLAAEAGATSPSASRVPVARNVPVDGPAPSGEGEADTAGEDRCLVLSRTLTGLLESTAATAGDSPDFVSLREAEGIGVVAEELLEEGDAGLAAELFEEAIALLEGDSG